MAPQYNKLTPEQERVIVYKGTEMPFTGEYDNFFKEGTFICRRCNLPLFTSKAKFDAKCGWPAFDDSFSGALERHEVPSMWGMVNEIECSNCHAHLGHEFTGEELTEKNVRECVNSVSIKFMPEGSKIPETIKGLEKPETGSDFSEDQDK